MYVDTPLNPIFEQVKRDSLKNVHALKVIGLNNGRELKYYIAPESEGKITVPEILDFMQIQAEHMTHDTIYPRDYTVGYRDAIEAIYLFIKKRSEEDSKKEDEINANCC